MDEQPTQTPQPQYNPHLTQEPSQSQPENHYQAPSQPVYGAPAPSTWQTPQPSTPAPVATTVAVEHKSTAVNIVLQWLSYGLWEWTLIGLSMLLSVTLAYFFIAETRSNDYSWLAYVVATVLVLLPFAFVLDRMYAKKEPAHKQGFSAVVLVINAVIVFLSAIGGLITCVVSVLTLVLSANPSSNTYVVIVSSLVVATLSLLLFLRIMYFPKLHKFNKLFPLIIVGITGLTAVLALAGPFKAEVAAKNDRLIEKNLPTVNSAIQEYVRKNKKLPSALSELDFSGSYEKDAKALIDKNLVEYTKKDSTGGTGALGVPELLDTSKTRSTTQRLTSAKFYYELCVTYKKASGKDTYDDDYGSSSNYISTYNHKAGRQCYTKYASLYEY